VSHITKAASILLARGSGAAELFVVRRSVELRFFGGFLSFPGGKVSPSDSQILVVPGVAGVPRERCVAAARELFEETGVLLARRPDGSYPASGSVLDYLRRKVIANDLSFEQALERLELTIRAADFIPLGAMTTPPFVPHRFDTAFYLVELPANQQADVWPGELDNGEWVTAAMVVRRWIRGECMVSPPTVAILQAVVERPTSEIAPHLASLFGSLSAGAIHPIYFAPGVQLIPLYTQSLPPSTHTNAYLVGLNPSYLLDPGTGYAEEQERLFAELDKHHAKGGRLAAVVLTHHHPDHIGAATACAERYGVPINAHPLTAQALAGRIKVTRHLRDGERLDLGTAPDGSRPWCLIAIHTPGHASGHLAFHEPHYRLLFAADMVSTLSSVVIAPPDGDLAVYLESLHRLRVYDCQLLLPAHGTPSARPRQVIDECIAHRVKREEQLLAALAYGPRNIGELAVELYKGLPSGMIGFAELQVRAGLTKLHREGRAEVSQSGSGEVWSRREKL
jgi:glyoxylase-like metal-dependent hydrolase (beta-lactamase superfamily II)/8-oxo-dGTP pyrophosphatase MutT (NUDIX family)